MTSLSKMQYAGPHVERAVERFDSQDIAQRSLDALYDCI